MRCSARNPPFAAFGVGWLQARGWDFRRQYCACCAGGEVHCVWLGSDMHTHGENLCGDFLWDARLDRHED